MKTIEPKEVVVFTDKTGKQPFAEWLDELDFATQVRIDKRLLRIALGNYGDHKPLKDGIQELRFTFGSGYRVYFAEDGDKIVVLLSGGDKSTQKKDIKKAIDYWKEYKND
ncbi:MAG: type II toxin-antitoxin system RelE/ParE family toxin [Alphaproteobacteria bacterium]